jgi:hypothetical protein
MLLDAIGQPRSAGPRFRPVVQNLSTDSKSVLDREGWLGYPICCGIKQIEKRAITVATYACDLAPRTVVTDAQVPGLSGNCWAWHGSHDGARRARVKAEGRNRQVRRLMLEATGEPMTCADEAIALCGCSSCVNPSHLLRGSAVERRAFSRHGGIDLGTLWVIKQMIAERKATEEDLARNLDISPRLLRDAVARVQ